MKNIFVVLSVFLLVFGLSGVSSADSIIPDDLAIDFRDYNLADGQDSYTIDGITIEALPNDTLIDYKISHDSEDGLGIYWEGRWTEDRDPDEIEGREQLDVDIEGGKYLTGAWITDLFPNEEIPHWPWEPATYGPEYGKLTVNDSLIFYFDGNTSDTANGEKWIDFGGSILVTDALFETFIDGYSEFSVAGFTAAPVPEPSTMLLFGAGLVGLACFGRKKFNK